MGIPIGIMPAIQQGLAASKSRKGQYVVINSSVLEGAEVKTGSAAVHAVASVLRRNTSMHLESLNWGQSLFEGVVVESGSLVRG